MNESKIEPRLRDEMRRLAQEGRESAPISVLVQIAADEPVGGATTYAALEQRLRAGARAVLHELSRSGFSGPIRENALAGSLEMELSSEQITAVSALAEVQRVILNRVDKVACAEG